MILNRPPDTRNPLESDLDAFVMTDEGLEYEADWEKKERLGINNLISLWLNNEMQFAIIIVCDQQTIGLWLIHFRDKSAWYKVSIFHNCCFTASIYDDIVWVSLNVT